MKNNQINNVFYNTANTNEKRDQKIYTRKKRIKSWMARRALSASFTLEAAVVVPIYLLAVCQIIFWSMFSQEQMRASIKMNNQLRKAAQYFYAGNELTEDLFAGYDMPTIDGDVITWADSGELNGKTFFRISQARKFTGRKFTKTGEKEGEIVFVAETGEVYHRDRNCSHIKLSVEAVSKSEVSSRRNVSGGKYYPCEKCMGAGGISDTVYIRGMTPQRRQISFHIRITSPFPRMPSTGSA